MQGRSLDLRQGVDSGPVGRHGESEPPMNAATRSRATLRTGLVAILAGLSWACGDFSGGSTGGATSEPSEFFTLSAQVGGVEAFETTVYPILREYCAECHEGGPGSPFIAHPTVRTAYDAVVGQGKVRLSNPMGSRLVTKLVSLNHHCWSNCQQDGAEMGAAIQMWADAVDYDDGGVSVDGALASGSQAFSDGIVDTGSERYTRNLVALVEFKEGEGDVARDTSDVEPPLNLVIEGDDVEWLSSWGVQIGSGRLVANRSSSRKLYDAIAHPITGSGQYTVEAWVVPANIDQDGPARIVTYSANSGSRNFTMGQVEYNYNFRNRAVHPAAANEGQNGQPDLQTYDADRDAQDRLQHVVMTYDPYAGRRIYVDAEFTDDDDPLLEPENGVVVRPVLWNWDPNHRLAVGEEPDGGRQWEGQVRLLAIYRQALTPAQIQQNFDAGVGERLLMRFDVAQWLGGGSSVEFTVTDFDAYSYMFCQPTVRTASPNGSRIANIRILVNDELAVTGQGFESVDTTLQEERQEISRQCTVVPKGDAGPDGDRFTLVFEHLGGFQNVVVNQPGDPADILLDPTPRPREGIRNFARMNASLAAVTSQDPAVASETYVGIQEQLPPDYDVRAFVSSNQVAIAKIALEYCDALVEDPVDRAAYFPGVTFDVPPELALATPAQRDLVFYPLYDRMVGEGLALQPTRAEVRGVLDGLVDELLGACAVTSCDAERTETIVKATCAALASSAAVALH